MEIYSIEPKTLQYYKQNAKNRNAFDQEKTLKWLTCIVNASEKKLLYEQVYLCKFSGFNLVVNEKTKQIINLYWTNKDNKGKKPSKEQMELLNYWKEKLMA